MKNMPVVNKAIEEYADKNDNIESYTKYSILVVEVDQIFVQFDGVPNRGTLTVWIKLPEECKDNPWNPLGHVAYSEEEEPRTVAFLRNEIDDLDYSLNQAKKTLTKAEHAAGASSIPSDMIPFMRLVVADAEDRRVRLSKELNDLF
jgi:hypothetical protein